MWGRMDLDPPLFSRVPTLPCRASWLHAATPAFASRPCARVSWVHLPVAVTPFFVALTRARVCPGMALALGELLPQLHEGEGMRIFSLQLALCNMIELGQVAAVELLCWMIVKYNRGFDASLPFCITSNHERFASLFPALCMRLRSSDDPIHHHWAPIILGLAPVPYGKDRQQVPEVISKNTMCPLFPCATPMTKALFKTLLQFGSGPGFNPNCTEPVHGCSLLQCLLYRGMFDEALELISVHGADVDFVPTDGGGGRCTDASSIPPVDIALQVNFKQKHKCHSAVTLLHYCHACIVTHLMISPSNARME